MKSDKIIKAAEEWIGTPFHPQGRQKHLGCDCIGLILGIAQEIGAISLTNQPWNQCDVHAYDAIKDSNLLLKLVPQYFPEITNTSQPGDILLIQITPTQYHLAIKSYNNRIIHACSSLNKVISHQIIPNWKVLKVLSYEL